MKLNQITLWLRTVAALFSVAKLNQLSVQKRMNEHSDPSEHMTLLRYSGTKVKLFLHPLSLPT